MKARIIFVLIKYIQTSKRIVHIHWRICVLLIRKQKCISGGSKIWSARHLTAKELTFHWSPTADLTASVETNKCANEQVWELAGVGTNRCDIDVQTVRQPPCRSREKRTCRGRLTDWLVAARFTYGVCADTSWFACNALAAKAMVLEVDAFNINVYMYVSMVGWTDGCVLNFHSHE